MRRVRVEAQVPLSHPTLQAQVLLPTLQVVVTSHVLYLEQYFM